MKLGFSKLARLGVFTLAMAVVPAVLPASAQTNNANNPNGNMDTQTTMSQSSSMVPGTGLTVAELRNIGYSQQQINDIRNTDLNGTQMAQNGNNATQGQSGAAAGTENGNQNNAGVNTPVGGVNANTPATGGGGGGWGLWGLVGLLGLLGLGRGRRRETVREDRDIRRVA